jgi:hypothetical protein
MIKRFVISRSDFVVSDRETGLAWQRGASEDRMVWKEGFEYIEQLNEAGYADHSDWRYPTQEEMATLLLTEENRETGLFIDPAFGDQRSFWTATEAGHHRACYVDFYYGGVYLMEENYANFFIRAVRSNGKQ